MSKSITSELEAANEKYVASFDKGHLEIPPSRQVAIVTCMDARIIPEKILGLEEGQAHIIRNAGGRTSEAVRSLVISQQLLGTREIVVIHHTDCGMLTFSDAKLREKLRDELGGNADHIAFLPFGDLEESVRDDVKLLRAESLVLDVPITGYTYDVRSGKLKKIEI